MIRAFIPLFVVYLACAHQLPGLRAQEIGFIEQFALAADRTKPLATLVPDTEDYFYYHCLHFQNTEQFDQVDEYLKRWVARLGHSARETQIRNRQALLIYDRDPQRALKYLQDHLGLNFQHQRELPEAEQQLPTRLDPNAVDFQNLLKQALSQFGNTDGIEDLGLEGLNPQSLNNDQLRHWLQRLQVPDVPGLTQWVARELAFPDQPNFGALTIHSRLTQAQLDELVRLVPRLRNDARWIETYLTRLRPSDDLILSRHPAAQIEYLDRLWRFAEPLDAAHNSLKAAILYRRLDVDRRAGVYDRERFIKYLQLPRQAGYVNPKFIERVPHAQHYANLEADYSGLALLPRIGSDEPLVRDYLLHFFRDEADTKAFEAWLELGYLRRQFAEAKIVNGLGDAQQWATWLSGDDYQALVQRVDLDFDWTNPEQFSRESPVRLKVHVKNVQKLIVKVFEINTGNFYRAQQREIDTDINLDGLVPQSEQTYEYGEAPPRRVERTFEFPELNRPGVFVVDFIGNGRSSRALIHKGQLSCLVDTTLAGQQFTVLDERRQPVTGARVWIGGHEYTEGKDGKILVPFSQQPGPKNVVLEHQGLHSLTQFQHQSESYQLVGGLHLDRESLLRGNQARLMIRAGLQLNGFPVTLKLLETPRLSVVAQDLDGVSTTAEFEGLALDDLRETLQEIYVPARLRQITLTLTGQVQNMTLAERQTVSLSQSYSINEIDATPLIRDVHLVPSEQGYWLEVRGKNGEPRAKQAVHVTLKHRSFRQPIEAVLQTDGEGRVELGPLAGIVTLQATLANSPARAWSLNALHQTRPAAFHGMEGGIIRIPASELPEKLTAADVSLLEMRGGVYVADLTEHCQAVPGGLELKDLVAGTYQLRLKATGETIQVRVGKGEVVNQWIVGPDRLLEVRNSNPLRIAAVEREGAEWGVRLAGDFSRARVHVYATRHYPRFQPIETLGGVRDVESAWGLSAYRPSAFLAGRDIGEEYRYILDRKYASKYPGNLLDRPTLLLNPWSLRTTENSALQIQQGGNFVPAAKSEANQMDRGATSGSSAQGLADPASLDFLAQPTLWMENLQPDQEGIVVFATPDWGDKQWVQIVVVGEGTTLTHTLRLPNQLGRARDLRLAHGLDPDKAYCQQKQTTVLAAGESLKIEDLGSSKLQKFDALDDVYRVFVALTGDAKLGEFQFILSWPKKTDIEKRELYSKYACHELNFFLYHKDPAFFQAVILPYLQNKHDKTFLDHWLLKQPIDGYLDPWQYQRLNVAERILLSQTLEARRSETQRSLSDWYQRNPLPRHQASRLFDFAIKGNDLSADQAKTFAGEKAGDPGNMPAADAGSEIALGLGGGGGLAAGQPPGANTAAGRVPAPRSAEFSAAEPEASRSVENEAGKKLRGRLRRGGEAGDALSKDKAVRDEIDRMTTGDAEEMLERRKQLESQRFYRRLKATEEWVENNFYRVPLEQVGPGLVPINRFWRDYSRHAGGQPFFSPYFMDATSNFTEMMGALAVLDLPFEPQTHANDFVDQTLTLVAKSPVIAFHQQVKVAERDERGSPILTSENFFRVDDRYRQEDGKQFDKFVTDEFLTQVLYGGQVVVTNPSSTPYALDVLIQIPQGSLPAQNSQATRTLQLDLQPFSTQTIEYFFYFPQAGQYPHYPAHLSVDQRTVASAKKLVFHVVDQPSQIDRQSWAYLSQHGSDAEVLEFLKRENLVGVDLSRIAFRAKNPEFYTTLLATLTDRLAFDGVLWSYAIHHNQPERIREYLQHVDGFVQSCGPALTSTLLTVDPIDRRWYQHKEYLPLVNERAHRLGAVQRITNPALLGQYQQLVASVACRREPNQQDLLGLTYYLLLQDRIDEGVAMFKRLIPEALPERLQYDYLAVYVAFYQEQLDQAQAIARKYADYPVDRWRNRFQTVLAQVDEAQGRSRTEARPEDRDQQQAQLAAQSPNFEFQIESRRIALQYQNLTEVKVNYYLMDVELLFSRNPFVQQQSGGFSMIQPNFSEAVSLPADQKSHQWALPESLKNANVLVEITGGGLSRSVAYYAHSLAIQVDEKFGYLQVRHQETQAPISKAYVKVYARLDDGSVVYYKDGYTDLRGRFDFASLSNRPLDQVQRFSILILSEQQGAAVREAGTPQE